ncbi:class I SAM-dependent methyltransferase [Thalassomonas viridans]|uniref:Class I SAM-dependent methyltransferase n=1 Tax=Thalassomonas viridans TaxID=137584 RepID=A0AAE9Z6Y0_9GAMM|nr:class I SAM-dependent methyltransferase [Thalassomonas viridans]WDE07911.1 class I SAM-dependent methyltransferase [Thalassomonas viridans]
MTPLPVRKKDVSRINGVLLLTPKKSAPFEDLYLKVRAREQWLVSDEALKLLPETSPQHAHAREWQIRADSTAKLASYLKRMALSSSDWLLDIGCGNGWQSHLLARHTQANVLAIDINLQELEQGARVFSRDNLTFAYLDLFSGCLQPQTFKFVLAGSCLQYFPDAISLIDLGLDLLMPGGEFHIIDSPFYQPAGVMAAKQRSLDYYRQLGFGQMSEYYHHHNIAIFDEYNSEFLYKKPPEAGKGTNPFPWIKLVP